MAFYGMWVGGKEVGQALKVGGKLEFGYTLR